MFLLPLEAFKVNHALEAHAVGVGGGESEFDGPTETLIKFLRQLALISSDAFAIPILPLPPSRCFQEMHFKCQLLLAPRCICRA